MSVALRYFNKNSNKPEEIFLGLQRLTSVDTESIFNNLSNKISEFGIIRERVIAVCFDGAVSMSGRINGVQAKVKSANVNT